MSEETEKLTRLSFWTINASGEKERVYLFVDKDMVIRSVEGELPGKIQAKGFADPFLIGGDLGITTKKSADGTVRITGVDEKTKRIMPFFTDRPCWFPNCEELRRHYFEDIVSLEKKAALDGRICRDCERGDILRKYIKILRKLEIPESPVAR